MKHRGRSPRTAAGTLAAVAALGLAVTLAVSAAAQARPQAPTASSVCSGTAKGAAWSYKGQKGSVYSVIGVSGVSCAIGIKFMPKWTRDHAAFDLKPVPAGWHCSAIGDYTTSQCSDSARPRKVASSNGCPRRRSSR